MSKLSILLGAAGLVACLSPVISPASAATAHNSQAGAYGPNKHTCAPTPYFQDGGCLTSFFTGQDDGWVEPRTERYQPRSIERPPLRPFDR